VNICIRNLNTDKEKHKEIKHFLKEIWRRILGPVMAMKKKIGGY
jgi:hypothetical protein